MNTVKPEWLTDNNHFFRKHTTAVRNGKETVMAYCVLNNIGEDVGIVSVDDFPEDKKPCMFLKSRRDVEGMPPIVEMVEHHRRSRTTYGYFVEGEITECTPEGCSRSSILREYTYIDRRGRVCGYLNMYRHSIPEFWDKMLFHDCLFLTGDVLPPATPMSELDKNEMFDTRFRPTSVVYSSTTEKTVAILYETIDRDGRSCGSLILKIGDVPPGWELEDFEARVMK